MPAAVEGEGESGFRRAMTLHGLRLAGSLPKEARSAGARSLPELRKLP